MNATIHPLQGFWPFFRKELSQWWRGRGALVTAIVLSALGILGTLAARIDELAGGTPTADQLDPTRAIAGAQFEQWIVFATIFASIGMLVNERSSGTLAWTLSKPLSRSALLLAKWVAGTLAMTVFGLAIPLAVAMGVANFAYGSLPEVGTIVVLALWLAAAAAFILALNLALATRVQSQGAIAAIAFAIALTPYIFGTFLPAVAELWPTAVAHMGTMVAAGEAPNLPTVAVWAATLAIVGAAGLYVFSREDM
jgi:ABC-type transport system involved in multi-copper enzyme maturation permease subunit